MIPDGFPLMRDFTSHHPVAFFIPLGSGTLTLKIQQEAFFR